MLDPDRIPENEDISTGMERKEEMGTRDIFWSREPITGPRGTKENPAIVPSFNDSRVVGLETEQVCERELRERERECVREREREWVSRWEREPKQHDEKARLFKPQEAETDSKVIYRKNGS